MAIDENIEKVNKLYQKCWNDRAFKEELINNPSKIIKLVGLKNDISLVVEDQSDSSIIFLNIPKKLDFSNMELTDEELEIVAGGEVAGSISLGIAAWGALYGLGLLIGELTRE